MSATHLRPDQRDRLLALLDLFTSAAATLRSKLVLQGHAVRAADLLFDAVASNDPLPALAAEQAANLLRLADAPRTYGALSRELLLGLPRVEQERADHAEMQAQADAETAIELRQQAARAKAEAEGREYRPGRPRKAANATAPDGRRAVPDASRTAPIDAAARERARRAKLQAAA